MSEEQPSEHENSGRRDLERHLAIIATTCCLIMAVVGILTIIEGIKLSMIIVALPGTALVTFAAWALYFLWRFWRNAKNQISD
jgi:hypothetical protein